MNVLNDILQQFRKLRCACIDASSVIVMEKAGFFSILKKAVSLYTIPAVLDEIGEVPAKVAVLPVLETGLSTDRALVKCACRQRCPVISEDKAVLSEAGCNGLPYFNALVMLHFLLFCRRTTLEEHEKYFQTLKTFVRYSPEVFAEGERIFEQVCGSLSNGL